MTAVLLKPRKTFVGRIIDVEKLLLDTFEELLAQEGVTGLSDEQKAGIFRAMRTANKIGYTNGFKKAATK